jgi:hypothetical protein
MSQDTENVVKNLEERIKELPPDLHQEVMDFVEFLLEKRRRRPTGRLGFTWAGALKDLREQYTSVELQHKILEWRSAEK